MRMHCEKICVRVWIEETVVTMTTRCSISPEHSQYYSSISGWSFVLRTGDTLWHHQLSPVTITESNGQSQTTQNMAAFKNTCSSRKKIFEAWERKKNQDGLKLHTDVDYVIAFFFHMHTHYFENGYRGISTLPWRLLWEGRSIRRYILLHVFCLMQTTTLPRIKKHTHTLQCIKLQ